MEMMTVLRAQLPLPPAPAPVAEASHVIPPGTVAAVAPPLRRDALQPARIATATLQVQLAEIDEDADHATAARAAAEAARAAYIKASIAAGVSPLPLR